jgi:hypothetical protein
MGDGGGFSVWEDRVDRLYTGGEYVPASFFVARKPGGPPLGPGTGSD